MKFDAKITRVFPEGCTKAAADLTIEGAITVRDVKLVDGKHGTFVSFPSRKWQDREGNEKRTDIVYPVTKEVREEIKHTVESAYNAFSQTQEESEHGIAM